MFIDYQFIQQFLIKDNSWMHYFKSIVKNVYDKVLEDDFLEPITQQEVTRILSVTNRRRLSSHGADLRKLSVGQPEKDLFEKIEIIGHVSPDREFRLLGADPRYEIINGRVKELKEDLEEVTQIMMDNFPKYQKKLTLSIDQLDNLKSLYQARKHSMELKTKLNRLQEANKKSKRITELNIRLKNLKATLKILHELPNIHRMSLIQLKAIKIDSLKSRETLSKLTSLQGVENFIDRIVSSQLANVLIILEQCLVQKFQEQLYENALKNFLVAQHESIKYEKLLIKLVEKEIRRADNSGGEVYQLCNNFIKLMINLHGVFRWHREHEEEEAWKSISEDRAHINITINIRKVTTTLTDIMDQCLKDTVLEKVYHYEGSQLLQMLYYLTRISQIVENFSGKNLGATFMAASNFLGRKLQKLRDKAKNQLKETLQLQKINMWNRLPVPNDYSYEPIDKVLFQIHRHIKSEDYKKVTRILKASRKIICSQAASEKKATEQRTRKRTMSTNYSPQELQKYISIKFEDDQNSEELEEEEQLLQIQEISFPVVQKYERFKEEVKLKLKPTQFYQAEVVLCQSSLTVLKYYIKLAEYGFYYPVPPCSNMVPDIMFFLFESYVFFAFNAFISPYLKYVFFSTYEEFDNVQSKYLKRRIHSQYPRIYEFIHRFKKEHNLLSRQGSLNGNESKSNKENEKAIRSRVVSMESVNYLSNYLQHIFQICGWQRPVQKQRLEETKLLYMQLSEIVYTDCIPRICNLKSTQSMIENMKWGQDEATIREFTEVLAKNFKEFFYQMKAQNKGEVPLHISQRLLGVFWKTQVTTILKTFFSNYRPTPNSAARPKNRLEKLIDDLYASMASVVKDKSNLHSFYQKVKSIFPILLEDSWEVALGMLQASLIKFQFVYVIYMKLIQCSESCCYLANQEMETRRKMIEEWLNNEFLHGLKGHGCP